jgi:hypothetical protein
LALAQQRNAGMVFVTSDKGTVNPWDSLPHYWNALASEVCRRNGRSGC